MKRLLALLLALMMLAGCTVDRPTEPPQTDPPTVPPTDPPAHSLYVADSVVEQQTHGAVRAYFLEGSFDGMALLKDRVVLYHTAEQMTLKAYTGDDLTYVTSASHHISIPDGGEGLQVSEQGIFYYDPTTRTMVILNEQLQEKHKVELPEGIQGVPVVNGAMDTAYYSTAEGIRALDLNSGIAHMLRQQENFAGRIYAQCFDGALLLCAFDEDDGAVTTEFISAETGLQVGKDPSMHWVESFGDQYFLNRSRTGEATYLFGNMGAEETWEFVVPEGAGEIVPALALGGVLVIREQDDGFAMDFVSLETGLRTASVTLTGIENPDHVTVDPKGYVWFMDGDTLYRWEVAKSFVTDEEAYTSPWQTEGDSNETALLECQADAAFLGEKYGVEIRIGKDAVAAPWENMVSETRAEAFEAALAELDELFSVFQEGMLADVGTICDSGKFTICIVADTGADQGQQTWLDGNAYVAVETGEDFDTELLRAVYRVMDTYILSKTSVMDDWDAEKPAEDRARYMIEALAEDNEDFFDDWYRQSKLRLLCRGIRRAFGMIWYEAELPWEQYLDDPLY